MMKNSFLLIVAALVLLVGCTDESSTVRTLEAAGYSNVQTTGYEFFECGEDDTFHTGFIATNPKGKRVSGTVCCGWLAKGCTIRF
jgi:hypothetical protein